MVFEILEFRIRHGAGRMFADRFEHVLNRDVVSLELSRHDGAAVDHE